MVISHEGYFESKEAALRENPPIMVLAEETSGSVTFRFRGNRWALATLIPGIGLVALSYTLYRSNHPSHFLLMIVGIFGLLLIYSSIYSMTADQWLTADGNRKTIKFYKKNLYGLVEWERTAPEFQGIQVGRRRGSSNWQIVIQCKDGLDLFVGEHALGAFSRENALNIANKITTRTGLQIDA